MSHLTRRAADIRRRLAWSWNLRKLTLDPSPGSASLARTLQAASNPSLTPEEKAWLDRIEAVRTEMQASTLPITRADYGAGNPDSNRSESAMGAGVEVVDTLGHITRRASKSAFWCRLLFTLVRTLRPRTCIEMGTAVGISAAYQAAALAMNGHGHLVTLEGAGSLADVAKTNFRQLGLDTVTVVVGRFQDTLSGILRRSSPVDYVFVDGHHDERATLAYFEQLLPFLADNALLVFDDIAWSEGMRRAWKAIASSPRAGIAVDLGPVGLCLVQKTGTTQGKHVRIPLD
jgi:predicted O-methyltransferase YrrM